MIEFTCTLYCTPLHLSHEAVVVTCCNVHFYGVMLHSSTSK